MTIEIAPPWMSEEALHTLSSGYLLPGETPRGMFERVSQTAAKINNDETLREDVFTCLWNGWLGLASSVAANFGAGRAHPISCYSVHIGDSIDSIYSHLKEVSQMNKGGGGVGAYFGDIRSSGSHISGGGRAGGIVPFAQEYDLNARVVSQGGVRPGSIAIYVPIDHPDVPELLRSKDHSKGDPRKFIDSNVALTITDEWIESMMGGDKEKQEMFGEILRTRLISGSPYLIFIDNVNRQNPKCYKERGLSVKTSNLCSEIFLHTDENHSFVCVISSLNLSLFYEFRDWVSPVSGRTVPEIAIHFLEAVVSDFIRRAKNKPGMGRAVRFAEKSRALGLGTMGLHSLYQKQGVPFASPEARAINIETHKWVREKAEVASRELAFRFGEPEWCVGTGMRHTHLTAIAPTRTNSVISGAYSQGIEPIDRNYFVAKQDKGTYVRKNPVLEALFCKKGVGKEVWDQILEAKGSVQELDCLTDREKEIFRTFQEIDQFEIVKQASDRQPYVCQGQSLNLKVDPESDPAYLLRLHLSAWNMGVKSLYYLKSSSLLTNKNVVPALIVTKDDCPYCRDLKEELRMDGIKYKEITKEEAVEKGYWNPEWTTVPQLWLYKKHIGGFADYLDHKGKSTKYKECAACEA